MSSDPKNVAPPPPAPPSHISESVREALSKQDPEIAKHVREVAGTK